MMPHLAEPPPVADAVAQAAAYRRIERAIRHLALHWREQPDLAALARIANLSPFYFQRLFARWAGVTPKQFLGCLTLEHAKRAIAASETVLGASLAAGLSGPGRLHDLFVALEAVSPGEYRAGGADVTLRYGFAPSPFGEALLGATARGIAALGFVGEDGRDGALAELGARWPRAALVRDDAAAAALARAAFAAAPDPARPIRVAVRGTNFQVQVWRALLALPPGGLSTYGEIARALGRPGASRAVGAACAANPVGWLIPCHRVIGATGLFATGYRWGTPRKLAMIGWEGARAGYSAASPSTSNME